MDTLSQSDLLIFAQELQAAVRDSNPIEQAKAFSRARGYSFSNRKMAAQAGCSEAHVRNMLELLDLPTAAQLRIASGEPYRPYLSGRREESQAETLDLESAASKGAECLRDWCKRLELAGGYAERALKEAKLRIKWGEDAWVIPQSDLSWRGTPEAAFDLFRRADYLALTGFKQIDAAADWLASALVYLMPNSGARRKALDITLVEASVWGTR